MRFTHRTGLAVELYEDHGAGSVAICWTYKSGFRDDPAGLAGLVHVGEHLVFEHGTTDSSGSVEHRAACQGIIAGAKTMPNCTQITFLCDAADVLAALELHLPGRPLGTPMTYEIGGRQYVALTITTDKLPELVALALPDEGR